ncbi:bidirectional sugar transporter NEC1-like isoform X2 [Durio zibethinus]|uniref:Bidirectional sugar transporter SWEET n=1 Tax=Durio zibethinus TaxID=66656 RepID=A0A6P5WU14_DURZI|nr:bidirectional sugar transporter NEC1-like isoform X2 [Durio zibethinus]
MGFLTPHHQLAFIFGVLGNIVSFLVFLAPVPTFYTIYKKKTAEGYQPIPYMVALSSAMMLLYYGTLKTDANLIISINSIGCATEVIYLVLYFIYAPKREKVFTVKWIIIFNLGGYCLIMRHVIRTKSVEHMPFFLSFFLTLCATMWFFYGIFLEDFYIALPNVLGFLFGIAQMILYVIYKNPNKDVEVTEKQQKGDIELNLSSVEDVNPCLADHQLGIKEITVVTAEKPVESYKINA